MAVYTELTETEISAFLARRYRLAPLKAAQGIKAGVENTNYRLELENGERYILTLFEKRVAEADLPFFTGLMHRLAGRGVPCPMPIAAENGEVVQRLKGKPAVIVSFLPGADTRAIQNAHLTELGAHLARLHLAGEGFRVARPNALTLPGWEALTVKIGARMDDIAPGLSREVDDDLKHLRATWPVQLPRGVIHADLFPDNVFFEGERLTGIIDFYFACNDLLVYDLAICLNAWCFEKGYEFNITKAALLLSAYHSVRPLSEGEREALPILARGAALRFLLTRAHDWLFPVEGALVTPHDPAEYLKKWRFHGQVRHYREYGL